MQISRELTKKILLHLLALLILTRLLFYPMYNNYKEKKESLNTKLKNYRTAMILSQSAISPSSNYLIRKVFNKTDNVTYIQTLLLSFIQELCQTNNITMLHFEFNEPSIYDKVSEITISIKLEGQPSNMVNFLKNLETYHKIIDIKSFELLEVQSKYSSTIVLTTYRIEDVY